MKKRNLTTLAIIGLTSGLMISAQNPQPSNSRSNSSPGGRTYTNNPTNPNPNNNNVRQSSQNYNTQQNSNGYQGNGSCHAGSCNGNNGNNGKQNASSKAFTSPESSYCHGCTGASRKNASSKAFENNPPTGGGVTNDQYHMQDEACGASGCANLQSPETQNGQMKIKRQSR